MGKPLDGMDIKVMLGDTELRTSLIIYTVCSGDPLSNMSLTFDTKEEAIAYAVKNGT